LPPYVENPIMESDKRGLVCITHPDLEGEIERLADKGFKYEDSIGKLFALIDMGFVVPGERVDPLQQWKLMPIADSGKAEMLDLRCIDPDDGKVTLIATLRGRTLYLASVAQATRRERAGAVRRAIERVSDAGWCPPRT
jgi:hypothetical protein